MRSQEVESYTVKDLMVPIEEYATVPRGTTLFEAILALELAQEKFDHGKYQHRAVLVLDEHNKVVGRISQLRVLNAIEGVFENSDNMEELKKFNFSDNYIDKLTEKKRLESKIMTKEALRAASKKLVDEFMQKPTPDEYVSESSAIDLAIHKLVAGTHIALLVTKGEGDEIVGVLRMADVFAATFHAMKEADLSDCL